MNNLIVIIGIVLLVLSLVFLEAWVVQIIWNAVMPALFGLKEITIPQSLGLMVLLNIVGAAFKKRK